MTILEPTAQPAETHGVSQILRYWLGDALDQPSGWPSAPAIEQSWFQGGPAVDAEITARFGPLVQQALSGGLPCWEVKPLPRLALLLLLDQFTRNVFRGQPQAFMGDTRAQSLVLASLQQDPDTLQALPLAGQLFWGMPLMHAEDVTLQERSVAYFETLAAHTPQAQQERVARSVAAAKEHRDIVARFGRFPHRNAVLGRTSTPEEMAFLKNGPRFGQ
ncbi:DUF924 family protein [Variovorax sp. HJSM1_2]|uniref:DUF924 family protein n=1 Tax=Variovorax sp. HJSM1_2 TaxID=3366263 RepID=UPI003BED7E30